MNINCVVCGKPFEAQTSKAKYCSAECKNHSRYNKRKDQIDAERNAKNQEIIKLYNQGLKDKAIADALGVSVTRVCSCRNKYNLKKNLTPFQLQVKQLRLQGLCSSEIADITGKSCKNISHTAKIIGLPFTEEEKKKSIQCGIEKQKCIQFKDDKVVEQFIAERQPDFEYAGNYTGSDGYADLKCKKCGFVFTRSMISVRHSERRVECPNCIEQQKQQRLADREAKRKADAEARTKAKEKAKADKFWSKEFKQNSFKVCPVCGRIFFSNNIKQYTCGGNCSKAIANNHKKDKRIAKIKNVVDDKGITLEGLYRRDNGICYLCGKPCDYTDYYFIDDTTQKITGNNYPSIDHVIPLSKGGRHSWDNIKLAHRICNSLKGDSPL